MDSMISISDNAAKQIKDLLLKGPNNVNGIIVGVDKTGCSGYAYKIDYATDEKIKNFDLIESKGVKVYVDPKASMFLIGSEMDYTKDKFASRFVFHNPNEKSTCGCGESFNI